MFGRKMFILSISPCNIQGFMKLHTHSIQHILYPIGIEGGTKSQLLAITLNSRFSSYPYFQFYILSIAHKSRESSQTPSEHKRVGSAVHLSPPFDTKIYLCSFSHQARISPFFLQLVRRK